MYFILSRTGEFHISSEGRSKYIKIKIWTPVNLGIQWWKQFRETFNWAHLNVVFNCKIYFCSFSQNYLPKKSSDLKITWRIYVLTFILFKGCAMALRRDFEYWGLDELLIEPCCALKYYPALEVIWQTHKRNKQTHELGNWRLWCWPCDQSWCLKILPRKVVAGVQLSDRGWQRRTGPRWAGDEGERSFWIFFYFNIQVQAFGWYFWIVNRIMSKVQW